MNLLFAINAGYVTEFLNCCKSIMKNGGESHYDAYILHSDLDGELQEAIAASVAPCITCYFVHLPPSLFDGFPESKRYPRQIYYRIAAPLLLPEHLDRVLYLDADLVVINPLRQLYETDFEGKSFAACSHTKKFLTKMNQLRLGIDLDKDVTYINTGVLLFNLTVLRQTLRLADIRAYADRRKQVFILPDQDILTALYGDQVKALDTMRYNLSDRVFTLYNADPTHDRRGLNWVRENTVIVHYCGKSKPWKDGYNGTLGVFYDEICG